MKMRFKLLFFFLLISLNVAAQEQFSVFFESNKHELAPSESKRFNDWIAQNPEIKIVGIHGFTDEDGTVGHNDSLASRRVDFIHNLIKGRLRIRGDFKKRSFGEMHQLSETKSENRKVTLFYLLQKDIIRENEILGVKPVAPPKPKPVKNYPDKLSFQNPDGTKSEFKLDTVFMKQVDRAKAGEKLKLENLNFRVNTFAIMPESRGKLYELLLVMQNNPNLKIDIQGHLCCMPVDRVDLSTQRAKAIYNFLVGNEIGKSRLSYKGFGSTQPIFTIPEKTEAERAANRRVEILIVEN
jgi:outer membrane protein OmpA-like peptidoglycan-associated protein